MLREQIAELKSFLKDKNAPFGVDLLIPQVGGSARKTKLVESCGFATSSKTLTLDRLATTIPKVNLTNSLASSSTAAPSSSSPPSVFPQSMLSSASTKPASST